LVIGKGGPVRMAARPGALGKLTSLCSTGGRASALNPSKTWQWLRQSAAFVDEQASATVFLVVRAYYGSPFDCGS
jgi:hypothetical protein